MRISNYRNSAPRAKAAAAAIVAEIAAATGS
jgi:hypothetical protein